MTRIYKMIICVIAIMISVTIIGCGKNPPINQENWVNIILNYSNISEYFELDGYLGYNFNDGQGDLASPWGDNYYYKGSGICYLEDKINSIFRFDYSDTINYTIDNFTTENINEPQTPLKWRAVILKAKQDIIIDWIKHKAYFVENVDNSNVRIQYSIKEYSHLSSSENIILNTLQTYVIPTGQPNQDNGICPQTIHEQDKYGEVALYREYYGDEIHEWKERSVCVKKGQLFCIEFEGVEQIQPTYQSQTNFLDIQNQTNLNFIFEGLAFDAKVIKN